MAKKRINKVIEVGFIPGIYNYCDRWCEKCEQQLHCMSFVMGKKIEEKGGFKFSREASSEEGSIWNRLREVFESTYEVLHELADEKGIKVEDIYAAENIDKEFWSDTLENHSRVEACNAKVEESDIIRICMIYEDLADKCLEKTFEFLDRKEEKAVNFVIDEALEVVNWYLDLIQAKMRRALYGFFYEKLYRKKEADDYNGSTKVALIAIDRSIESWQILKVFCGDHQQNVDHLLVVLKQLRKDVEKQFPHAREFQRPGFEKPVLFHEDV